MKRLFLLLIIIGFVVIALLPFIFLVIKAIAEKPDIFQDLLTVCMDARTMQLMGNSFSTALGATVLALFLGVPVGFLLSRTDVYFNGAARYLVFLPIIIPDYILAMSWTSILGNEQGVSIIYSHWGVMWVLGLAYLPFVCLLTMAGLASVNRKLEEQALLMTKPRRVLQRITVPLIMPFISAGGLFVFIFSLVNYGVCSLLRVNTFPLEIFAQFSVFYNSRLAVLSCLPLLLTTLCLMLWCYFLMKDKFYFNFSGVDSPPIKIRLKKYRLMWSFFIWVVIFIAGILPLGVLIVSAGSFESYRMVFQSSSQALLTSFTLSAFAATVCVILGFYLGYILERSRGKWKRTLDVLTLLPLAVPPTVLGIGLIQMWNQEKTQYIYSGFLIVILGLTARFVPFSIRILGSCLKQIHPNMEEAAMLNGAGFFKTTVNIFIPLCRRGLIISWVICFIFCMGEVGTTLMIVPAGVETLGNKIYTLLHYGVGKLTAALSVVLIGIIIIPIVTLGNLLHRWEKTHD